MAIPPSIFQYYLLWQAANRKMPSVHGHFVEFEQEAETSCRESAMSLVHPHNTNGSLGDEMLQTEATSLLCLKSTPVKLSVLGGSGSLSVSFASTQNAFQPSLLLSQACRVFKIFRLSY